MNEITLKDLLRALEQLDKQMQKQKAMTPTSSLLFGEGMWACSTEADIVSAMVVDDALEAWFPWLPTTVDPQPTKILGWVGPEGTSAGSPVWDRTGECTDCVETEWGKCELLFYLGEACGKSAPIKLTQIGLQSFPGQPRYYIRGPMAGQPITNELDWQVSLAANVMAMNLRRQIVVGNRSSVPSQFNGLQVLINQPVYDARTGARCMEAEPIIYDWGSGAVDQNICKVIEAIVRRIRTRAQFLGGVDSAAGDMVLVMTPTMRDALLDWAACGCTPCQSTSSVYYMVDALQRREERARLAGGLYGMGQFEVDGVPVPIITTTWIPETESTVNSTKVFCSDIFVLTRKVGAGPVFFGQYQDFAATLAGVDIQQYGRARVSDGGKVLIWVQSENDCTSASTLVRARLVVNAPWLQGRITNVCAPFALTPLSAAPGDDYFYAGPTPTKAAKPS